MNFRIVSSFMKANAVAAAAAAAGLSVPGVPSRCWSAGGPLMG